MSWKAALFETNTIRPFAPGNAALAGRATSNDAATTHRSARQTSDRRTAPFEHRLPFQAVARVARSGAGVSAAATITSTNAKLWMTMPIV